MTSEKSNSAPLLIIKKVLNDSSIKEYKSIEDAIEDLENDPNVPKEKLEKLRTSLKNLKSKTSIKIMNGEIIK
jgi:septal ring factor EnvC (AmiA/AmiB activator)